MSLANQLLVPAAVPFFVSLIHVMFFIATLSEAIPDIFIELWFVS